MSLTSDGLTFADVIAIAPVAGSLGIVVRNIPSGIRGAPDSYDPADVLAFLEGSKQAIRLL